MIINANTKIAPILKQNAAALDAIVSISPAFEKLRNPFLRRVMAGRTSLVAAAKLGHCSITDFFQKLEPLGFTIEDKETDQAEKKLTAQPFFSTLTKEQLVQLDVRQILSSGTDPLNAIMEAVKGLAKDQVLKVINSFEPTPLINLLEKKGFASYINKANDKLVETYFYKRQPPKVTLSIPDRSNALDWDVLMERFNNRVLTIDVPHLPMPQPMHAILEALDRLPAETALYIYHKRLPVFLLPELAERGFDYRVKEIADSEVHLLIFKD